jgi:general stress protein YciG
MSIGKRGFASLTSERRHELAVKGGKANENRHRFTPKEAKAAGRKGGSARRRK